MSNLITRSAPGVYHVRIQIQDGHEDAGPFATERDAVKGYWRAQEVLNGKLRKGDKEKGVPFLDEAPERLDSEPRPWPPTAGWFATSKRHDCLTDEDITEAILWGAPLDALRLEVLRAISDDAVDHARCCATVAARGDLSGWDIHQVFNGIWSVLCLYLGEREGERGSFIHNFTSSRTSYEWRLSANLQAGCKFWRNDRRYYVEPYHEMLDRLTGEDRRVVARVNMLLSRLPYLVP